MVEVVHEITYRNITRELEEILQTEFPHTTFFGLVTKKCWNPNKFEIGDKVYYMNGAFYVQRAHLMILKFIEYPKNFNKNELEAWKEEVKEKWKALYDKYQLPFEVIW